MEHRTSARMGPARRNSSARPRDTIVRPAYSRIAPALLLLLLASTGCTPEPIRWDERRAATSAAGDVVVTPSGAILPDSMASLAARIAPPPGPVCPGSLRLSRARTTLFATWWAVRSDSGAVLRSARTTDEGQSWSASAVVDSTDSGAAGCRRSPPAIAADSVSGYVHVVYALQAKEGPGLFFSHSMDAGATFHEPVPIFYGERLGLASVASDGDVVAVAFEDPNGSMPRVGLALSRTMGHIFEERLLPVSEENGSASRPLAAVQGRRIAVAWERRAASDTAPAALAVRTGELR